MSNTRIRARITDQAVELVNVPLLASGSAGVLQIQCEFDNLWSGYGKTAVFYKTEDEVYHIPVASNLATVPQEVLADDGEFFFGVMGISENTRTTEVVRLQVKQGAISKSTAKPATPTPDIYQQLVATYGVLEARFDQAIAMKGVGNTTEHTLSDEYISGTIKTNGAVGYIEFTISGLSLVAGGSHYTDFCVPPELAALCQVWLESTNTDLNVAIRAASEKNDGWSRILIENVGSSTYTTDMVTTIRGDYPLATIFMAELADMRATAGGKTYNTAGEALRDQMANRPGMKGIPDATSFNHLTANLDQGFYRVHKNDWADLPGTVEESPLALLVFWYTKYYYVHIAYSMVSNMVAYRIVKADTHAVHKDWFVQTDNVVQYTDQELSDAQQEQARNNIGAASADDLGEVVRNCPGMKGIPDAASFNRLTANLDQGFYRVHKNDWEDLPGTVEESPLALLVFWYTKYYYVHIAFSMSTNLFAYRIVRADTHAVHKDWSPNLGEALLYTPQELTDEQKAQARENIGAASIDPIEDRANTKVTLTVTAGQLLDLRGIYRQENYGGVTRIDWGDGSKNNVIGSTDDEMKHTYATAGTYTITLVGLANLTGSTFREKNVSAVEIGTTVQFMGPLAFTANPSLAEIRIYAEVPPEISLNSGGSGPFDNPVLKKESIIVPENSLPAYMQAGNWVLYKDVLTTDETKSTVLQDKVVTVGVGGDFATINDALAYLSRYYPAYKANGIKCEIQILAGTIITEQIFVERTDLSYITITSVAADNTVQVAPSAAWTGLTHDTRGNKPFISGENGARLPCIKCLFSCIVPEGGWVSTGATEDINCAVGYFCNRGSAGVIAGIDRNGLANIGFENFYDNIIANNNSEIVLREAYARGAARYGVMSRHISRVSARSANITNCGDTAAYADRASMLDVRHADLTGSKNGIAAYHASTVTANETVANNISGTVADAQYGSTINCQAITAAGSKDTFKVTGGATIVATGAKVTNATGTKYSQTTNTLTANGVIYA